MIDRPRQFIEPIQIAYALSDYPLIIIRQLWQLPLSFARWIFIVLIWATWWTVVCRPWA